MEGFAQGLHQRFVVFQNLIKFDSRLYHPRVFPAIGDSQRMWKESRFSCVRSSISKIEIPAIGPSQPMPFSIDIPTKCPIRTSFHPV